MNFDGDLRGLTLNRDVEEKLNQQTVLLHEACECGDVVSVREIISNGRADVDVLMGGHRAQRSALHKAASYGHTDIVKLLLQHGANADKQSSVQRTPLHEACMGGHKETLMELVKYSNDLNVVDNRHQTAAHIAAYHGETECLKVLIDHSCDINCEDSQSCSPGHMAVVKDHADCLRCLLQNDINILQGDDQGRTAIHYAALYGSLDCLKVFRDFHTDLTVMDNAGATPAHLASLGNHLACLKFFTKSGLALDGKDNSGKTTAHYAAQKGSTECLHWILEQGLDASITDGSGNTPAHSAAAGHMLAMNCLSLHKSNMLLTNLLGDTPDMLSRKHGQTVAFQKAVNGGINCQFCVKKQKQIEYDLSHQPSQVEKNIKLEEKVIFKSPLKTRSNAKPKQRNKQTGVTTKLSKRDLSTKYYGEHLFSMTSASDEKTESLSRKE